MQAISVIRSRGRNVTIDIMRASAVVLMIIFHFCYDLKFLGVMELNIPSGLYWEQFRWVILILFFLCIGISLRIVHGVRINWAVWSSGVLKIFSGAIFISIVTYVLIPENWIFFGVLHFITLAYFFALPLVRFPKFSLAIGAAIVLLGALEVFHSRWPMHLIFESLPLYTNDFVRIFPWMGVVLIGIYLADCQFLKDDSLGKFFKGDLSCKIALVSKNSLLIYLLHQPILLGGIYFVILISRQY
ncbi:heparan-alpha-glucosaminide N-acetyltransferase [Shewanella waksmanii]|uniref:heparan-alpha-glucosaminide N-acetyltransferase n=1 Tax=Shewanella waksmanii TaxID=213783 RepID=UPI00373562E2